MKRINQMEPWLDEKEQEAVSDYLKSGGWLTEFKKTREFERMVADYVGSKYCSVVSNGTVSLAVALMTLGVSGEDEVLVPDYTMIASANAVVLAGARPVLVDIDPVHLCMDMEAARQAITKKTKAVMLVTLNGRAPDMAAWVEFCRNHNLYLIEDAAQSLGSRYQGKHLGTFGIVGSFSFSTPKIITTGQGGALVTDDEDLYKKIVKVKDFGREKAGVDSHGIMGYNFKFTDLQAVIGVEQMKKLAWRVERKKEIFKKYKDILDGIREIEFVATDLENTSPWFIDLLVPPGKRAGLIAFLEGKNIGSRVFYPAIHTQPPYHGAPGNFKNAETVSARGLWLPSSSFLRDEDIVSVCNAINEFFAHA